MIRLNLHSVDKKIEISLFPPSTEFYDLIQEKNLKQFCQSTKQQKMGKMQLPNVRYPLSNYVGIWREMHLDAHVSGNTCVLEVDPKSQLPVWIHMYEFIRTRLGSWSQISTSLRLFHYTPLHSPLYSPLHSVCNSYIGTLPLRTSWERRQSTFATTSLRYMCVMFRLSAQVSTKHIILCTNLTVRLK